MPQSEPNDNSLRAGLHRAATAARIVAAGCQPVIHDDHGPISHVERGGVVAVSPLSPSQLEKLLRRDGLNHAIRDLERLHHVLVKGADPAGGNGAIASSSWPGSPSLRTRKISSGTSRALAISNATGTPPRGSAAPERRRGRHRQRACARAIDLPRRDPGMAVALTIHDRVGSWQLLQPGRDDREPSEMRSLAPLVTALVAAEAGSSAWR